MLDGDYSVTDPLTGATTPVPRVALWGPASRTRIGRADGRLHVFVVILTARGARMLSGLKLADLVDRRLDIAAMPPRSGDRWASRIASAPDFETRCDLAARWLAAVTPAETPAASIVGLVDEIAHHRLGGPVSRLSRREEIGARALHRRFVDQAGWPPKTWLRVTRLQRVLRTLHPRAWGGPATNDAYLEFTDEAHLARDFRDLTGISPAAYRRAKLESGDPLIHTLLHR